MHLTHRTRHFVGKSLRLKPLRERHPLTRTEASFSSDSASNISDRKVHWRESATLLLVKPSSSNTSSELPNSTQSVKCNQKGGIDFLLIARSEKSKFWPGSLVFPGGNVSHFDSSSEWLDLYKKFGLTEQVDNFQCLEPRARKPEIYHGHARYPSMLRKEVSLRITAIRETFEECGILMCKPVALASVPTPAEKTNTVVDLPDTEIVKWQARVKANPDEFLTLCHELEVVPNLHGLFAWSNWLSPVNLYRPAINGQTRPRRFDVMFYMTILKDSKPPKVIIDPEEVGSYKWCSASQVLQDGIHRLTPPQFYELTRLRDSSLEELEALIKMRQQLGIERWCAYLRMTSDGAMGCLPGDDLMPNDSNIYDFTELEHIHQTWAELEKSTSNFHRWQITGDRDGTCKLLVNTHNYGQKYHSNENVSLTGSKL